MTSYGSIATPMLGTDICWVAERISHRILESSESKCERSRMIRHGYENLEQKFTKKMAVLAVTPVLVRQCLDFDDCLLVCKIYYPLWQTLNFRTLIAAHRTKEEQIHVHWDVWTWEVSPKGL